MCAMRCKRLKIIDLEGSGHCQICKGTPLSCETLDQRGCESADVLPGSNLAPNVVNALLSGLCKVGARGARNEQDVAPTYSRV